MSLRKRASVLWACAALGTLAGVRVWQAGPEPPVLEVSPVERQWTLDHPEFLDVPVLVEVLRRPPSGRCPPRLFVHLRSESGTLVRTYDHLPPPACVGSELRHPIRLVRSALDEPLPAGRYELSVGAHLGPRKLPVRGPAGVSDRVILGHVELPVPPGSSDGAIRFSGSWEDPEGTGTLQHRVVRRFRGHARVELASTHAAREVQVEVSVPKGSGQHQPESPGSLVEIRASCSREAVELDRPGMHQAVLRVPPGRPCTLHFEGPSGAGSARPAPAHGSAPFLASLSWRTASGTERASRR